MSNTYARQERVSFGTYELDPRAGELHKANLLIHLPPQPLKILALLASRPGELVTRDEIKKEVWGTDTFVDFEHGLNFAIKCIREALCDDALHPRYIETLPRRGYRFIAPVEASCQGMSLSSVTHPEPNKLMATYGPVQERRRGTHTHPATRSGKTSRAMRFLLESALGFRRDKTPWRRIADGVFAVGCLVCILVAFNGWGARDRILKALGMRPSISKITSIAVMPLSNLSGDPQQEYFADGMTEELISSLAKIKSLRVVSRTTVMRLKGTTKSLPQIARELNVDGIVEGSVVRFGNRARITANLLYGPTDRHLWSDTYESDVGDVLIMQAEVARSIAEQVRTNVTPQDQARLAVIRTYNPAAIEAYLMGRYQWSQLGISFPCPHEKSLVYFTKAAHIDPTYAPAFAGVARATAEIAFEGKIDSLAAYHEAKDAALKAVELDEDMAEGHVALGNVRYSFEWDWAGAERELRRAVELEPNNAIARESYALYLTVVGRFDEAAEQLQRAFEIEPVSRFMFGYTYVYARRYDAAIAQFQEELQRGDTPHLHSYLAACYVGKGMYTEALRECATYKSLLAKLWPEMADRGVVACAQAAMALGHKRRAAQELGGYLKLPRCDPYQIAGFHVALGDKDKAFECLEKAYQLRSPTLTLLKVDPAKDPLRSDPRFQALIRKMNFPP